MPTILTHAIVPLAAGFALGRGRVSPGLAIAGAALALLPDADVIGFKLGIAYADDWGHRGASHSLFIAGLLASAFALVWQKARNRFSWMFLLFCSASHGLLDMATDGGLGVALFWPFATELHFFIANPIRVSPIGSGFLSARGVETIWSELTLVWLPVMALSLTLRARRLRAASL